MTVLNDEHEGELKREALAWLARFSLGEADAEDRAALRRWRDTSPAHDAALAEAARLWRSLGKPVEELARAGAEPAFRLSPKGARLSRRTLFAGSAAAAAAGVLAIRPPLSLWPSLAELSADHRTAIGEQRNLNLAGKAISVDLNTRTSLSVHNSEQEVEIELISGEAAVTVSKADRRLVVVAGNGRTTASAATFTLRHTRSGARLTCVSGVVGVACAGRDLVIKAAEQVSYDEDGLGEITRIDPVIETAWRDGLLMFRNTPLSAVIDEVNRYRPGRIILMDSTLGGRLVTARFEIARIETVMGQIAKTFQVPVTALPGGVVLVG